MIQMIINSKTIFIAPVFTNELFLMGTKIQFFLKQKVFRCKKKPSA